MNEERLTKEELEERTEKEREKYILSTRPGLVGIKFDRDFCVDIIKSYENYKI